MVIQRLTTKCGDDKCYQIYLDGEHKGTFKESESVTAEAEANELIEDLVISMNHKGITPKVMYK